MLSVLGTSLAKNSKEGFSYLALGILLDGLRLLESTVFPDEKCSLKLYMYICTLNYVLCRFFR